MHLDSAKYVCKHPAHQKKHCQRSKLLGFNPGYPTSNSNYPVILRDSGVLFCLDFLHHPWDPKSLPQSSRFAGIPNLTSAILNLNVANRKTWVSGIVQRPKKDKYICTLYQKATVSTSIHVYIIYIYMYIHINMFIIIYYIHTNDKYDMCIYPGSQPPSRQMVVNDGSFGILINPYLKHGGSQTSKIVVGLQGYRHYILGYMYINCKNMCILVYILYIYMYVTSLEIQVPSVNRCQQSGG